MEKNYYKEQKQINQLNHISPRCSQCNVAIYQTGKQLRELIHYMHCVK